MEKNNIILIGMPGAGKSTAGVVVAKILGYRFVDSDLVIQETEHRLLHEIIEEEGIDGFLAIENRVNAALEAKRSVIATGGSVIYGKEAMTHLRSIGTVVYLKLGYGELLNRLGDLKYRGVVMRDGQTLRNLYEERSALYEKYAHITLDEDGKGIEATIQAVIQAVK